MRLITVVHNSYCQFLIFFVRIGNYFVHLFKGIPSASCNVFTRDQDIWKPFVEVCEQPGS